MERIVVLLIALCPASAIAQFHQCGGPTQHDNALCAYEDWQEADRELNRLWKEVKPLADARGTGQALLEEQRAWLRKRDATCDPVLEAGGSLAQMLQYSCLEDQTLQRNELLRALR